MSKVLDENEEFIILWTRFKQGDEKAFSTLFELSSERLFRYGIKFSREKEIVKDCIQEVFIKLYQNRTILPDISNPLYYLFKSLKNMLIDTLERKNRIVYFPPQELPFQVRFVFDPDDQSEVSDSTKEKFEKVISLLSDRQKEAIYLRFNAEMSYEEISELLGINYQSARNLIHRSLEKIRKEMDLKIFIALFISVIE